MTGTTYNYSSGEAYAKKLGLVWIPEWVVNFDQHAAANRFTQAQVDIAIQHHLIQVRHLFNPSTYTFPRRIALALHFIFGRSK